MPHIQGQQQRFVVYALGGSGKTQICLKFAEDHREEFWRIFWMDASSAESLERGYLQLAKVCGLEVNVAVAQRWLSNIWGPWALILDNADDPRLDLSGYLPVGNRGVVLITTQNPDCKIHATVGLYQLGAMATEEAVTLMLKTAGTDVLSNQSMRKAATPVVSTLGCLALAITQAGAVMRQGRYEMGEYCTVFARRRKELLSHKAIQGGEDYRYTVYTTWEVSRQMIEEMSSEAERNALELLQLASLRGHSGRDVLPGMILRRQIGQERDTYPLRAAVSVLLSFFREGGIFYLQRLGEDCQRMAASIFTLVYSKHPDTLGSMQNLALRYSEVGRRQEALQLTKQVLEAYKSTLGEEHPDTRASIDTLSYLSRNLQRAHETHRPLSDPEPESHPRDPKGVKRDSRSPFTRLWRKLK